MDGRRNRGQPQQVQPSAHQGAEGWLASSAEFLLSNYDLGRKIGNGSFGVVRLAQHKLTGHHVAVKIISKKKLQEKDPNSEDKLRREIKILSMLHHPHILRMYEVIETPEHIYIVTEYVEGGELFDHITRVGRLAEPEARHLFQQMVAGIEYCHRHMVVHRDLKPENLLLDSRSNIKIIDFGLSNVMREGYFLKTSCGSFNYAAPEVIKGARYAGPEVDVWSSGVVLYALLCGVLPFNDDMQQGIPYVLRKILAGTYSIPHWVSPQAQDLIARMLRVDPLQRITVAEIKQHPWFRFNLPRYVALVGEDGEPAEASCRQPIDETALLQAEALGFSRDVVVQSLEHSLRNKAVVTYWLLADALQRQRQATSFGRATISPASVVNLVKAQGLLPPDSHADPSSILQQRLIVERVYRLGVRSTAHPFTIMSEVVRVLLRIGVAWKKAGRYCLRCRCLVLPAQGGAMLGVSDTTSQCLPAHSPLLNAVPSALQAANGHGPGHAVSEPILQAAAAHGRGLEGHPGSAGPPSANGHSMACESAAAMEVDGPMSPLATTSHAPMQGGGAGHPAVPSSVASTLVNGHHAPARLPVNGAHSPAVASTGAAWASDGACMYCGDGRSGSPCHSGNSHGSVCSGDSSKRSNGSRGLKQGSYSGQSRRASQRIDAMAAGQGHALQGGYAYATGRASAAAVTRALENCTMVHPGQGQQQGVAQAAVARFRPPLPQGTPPGPRGPGAVLVQGPCMSTPSPPPVCSNGHRTSSPIADASELGKAAAGRTAQGQSVTHGGVPSDKKVAETRLPMVGMMAPHGILVPGMSHAQQLGLVTGMHHMRPARQFQVIPGVRLPSGELGADPVGCTVLRFELQLFKARDGVYILDFHTLQGPVYMVLDLCARFMEHLHV